MKKYLRLIGILLFIVILLNVDAGAVWTSFSTANPYVLFSVIALNFVVLSLRSLRWVELLKIQNINFSFDKAFWSYLRSLYLGNVTPARVGELSRAHYLLKYSDTSSAIAVSSVIFDKLLDMYFLLVLGIVGLLVSDIWNTNIIVESFFIFMLIAIPLFVIFPGLTLSIVRLIPNFKGIRDKSVSWLTNFFEGIRSFIHPAALYPVILTCIVYLFFFIQCSLLAYGLNINIDFFYLAFCVVVFSALSLLPISISNMGTREFVLIFMFSYIKLSSEIAVSYSLLFFIAINLILVIFGWLAFVFYNDKKSEQLNNIYKDNQIV